MRDQYHVTAQIKLAYYWRKHVKTMREEQRLEEEKIKNDKNYVPKPKKQRGSGGNPNMKRKVVQ
jgi:hypothetical protein